MHEGWLRRILKPKPVSPDPKVLWGESLVMEFHRYLAGMPTAEWDLIERVLQTLLIVIAKYGALGAKTQNGFGAVSFPNPTLNHKGSLAEFLAGSSGTGDNDPKWFDLRRTVFLAFDVLDPGVYVRSAVSIRIGSNEKCAYEDWVLPIAYDIRFKSQSKHFKTQAGEDVGLRPLLKGILTGRVPDVEDIVGSSAKRKEGDSSRDEETQRTASRVFVTHLYRTAPTEKYRFRVWVHVPADSGITPREVGAEIQRYVLERLFRGSKGTILDWNDVRRDL
jgi:hypothetical protein